MRSALVLVATLLAAQASMAAETDVAGPPQAKPRYPYPKSERVIASPITDHFALSASFFAGTATTDLHLDSSAGVPGTVLSAEHDLGLNSRLNQAQMELIFRLRQRHMAARTAGKQRDHLAFGDVVVEREVIPA